MNITVTVNGTKYERDVEPRMLLAYFLRESLGLTGTHVGCDTSSCGCCVVALDGDRGEVVHDVRRAGRRPRDHDGRGLEQGGNLHPLQQAFWDQHGLQCGYCTPGMMMTSYACSSTTRIRARQRFAKGSPAISAAAPAIRTSSRPCSRPPGGIHAGDGGSHDDRERQRTPCHRPIDEAQGRPALDSGRGQLSRRHRAPAHALSGNRAQPVPARAHQEHR